MATPNLAPSRIDVLTAELREATEAAVQATCALALYGFGSAEHSACREEIRNFNRRAREARAELRLSR